MYRFKPEKHGWIPGLNFIKIVPFRPLIRQKFQIIFLFKSFRIKVTRKMDYRSTLNLPETDFPMRANLPQREPDFVRRWEEQKLYHRIREQRKDRETFVLHDGPPYANGAIHLGTGLNKILKDMVNKSRILLGLNINYRPGWDCHGLPIELNVTQALTEEEKSRIKPTALRKKCRNFALKFVDKHRQSFKRLGVIGEFERPYLTLNPGYEAEELRQFNEFVKRGIVYQGLKPIHWCWYCQTALAEAEVEYENHISPSIYVRFPLAADSLDRLKSTVPGLDDRPVNVIIWTTTPWTLPANRAVALHPNLIYEIIPCEGEYVVLAKDLTDRFFGETRLNRTGDAASELTGKELEDLQLRMSHPLAEGLTVPIIVGTHVTLEQGTGAVHTAPGHGHEDYIIGQAYGLEVFAPVNSRGELTAESPVFSGMKVEESNQPIIDLLQQKGLLVFRQNYEHSYPHCWRCKNPIIFRATRQWFVSLEKENLRARLLEAIDKVNWVPSWGRQRIRSMVENRVEWCISRQRVWGVPIPAIYIGDSEEGILDQEFISQLTEIVAQEGTDFWFRAIEEPEQLERLPRLKELLPAGKTLADIRLEKDILDVWFDSGVSHHSVMAQDEGIYPVDMYLEGSDQHRGWFQSALVTAIAAGYEPPYRTVLTHGFTVDEKGRKLSKSLGNYVDLDKLIQETGVDVLRLWVSAEDFRGDMSFSPEIFKRVTESYRRIRNTARFLLSNLNGYSPADSVPENERQSLDQWIMNRWRETRKRIVQSYRTYDFHRIFYDLNNFCSVDLSALYLDIIKDRLYVSGAHSLPRKSVQSTLADIVVELTACTAPILSFTSEEIWDHLKRMNLVKEESVFLYSLESESLAVNTELLNRWDQVLQLRAEAVKAIEQARKEGIIGHSLDSRVVLQIEDSDLRSIAEQAVDWKIGDDLSSVLIVSQVELGSVAGFEQVYESPVIPGLKVAVTRAAGEKCPRCWHYSTEIVQDVQEVCDRCKNVLESDGLVGTQK